MREGADDDPRAQEGRGQGHQPVQLPVAGILPARREHPVERDGQQDERAQHEPHDAPHGEQRENEREDEGSLLEERQTPSAPSDEPGREQREEVEGNRRDRKPRRTVQRARSEEHTSELQSLAYLVCRLLLEKKNRRQISRR